MFYCINDPELNLTTTLKKGFAIKVTRCVGDHCSSDSEIDSWLQNKRFSIDFINAKLDIESFEEIPLYREWTYFPVIPLDE